MHNAHVLFSWVCACMYKCIYVFMRVHFCVCMCVCVHVCVRACVTQFMLHVGEGRTMSTVCCVQEVSTYTYRHSCGSSESIVSVYTYHVLCSRGKYIHLCMHIFIIYAHAHTLSHTRCIHTQLTSVETREPLSGTQPHMSKHAFRISFPPSQGSLVLATGSSMCYINNPLTSKS